MVLSWGVCVRESRWGGGRWYGGEDMPPWGNRLCFRSIKLTISREILGGEQEERGGIVHKQQPNKLGGKGYQQDSIYFFPFGFDERDNS